MKFVELKFPGLFLIKLDLHQDERGFFARTYCRKEFQAQGLSSHFEQCNLSYNKQKGTVRGMHFQSAPHEEVKLVRCIQGSIYDILVDLRPNSPTYKKWLGIELKATNYQMLYVPEGIAHGFQTLEDDTQVFYQMSSEFHSESARGIRWDDPSFNIQWPLPITIISKKDQEYPSFSL